MSFPAEDLAEWQRKYDYVTFPTENGGNAVHDIIPGKAKSPGQSSEFASGSAAFCGDFCAKSLLLLSSLLLSSLSLIFLLFLSVHS